MNILKFIKYDVAILAALGCLVTVAMPWRQFITLLSPTKTVPTEIP